MRYLVSVAQEVVAETDKDKWAAAGEPVIPWFPAPPDNVFISTTSFKRAVYAISTDVPDLNLDKLSAALQKYYPGLPKNLLDNYVLATAKAAHIFPVGTKVQIIVEPSTAKIFPVSTIEQVHVLWTEQPLKG